MQIKRFGATASFALVAALTFAACGSGATPAADEVTEIETDHVTVTDAGEAPAGEAPAPTAGAGIVTVNGSEPQNPLIPSNTMEVGGGVIIDHIFDNLIFFDAEGNPHNAVAESIETDDNQTWHITLRPDAVFSDGTPVTSDSFARAWEQGALLSNGHLTSFLFENIEGFSYDEDSSIIDNGGVVVEDPTHFTVHLKEPQFDFGISLGHSAFAPLPDVAFTADGTIDPAFGQNPIGNGPYMLQEWNHDRDATLVVNPTYNGPRMPQNGGIQFVFYANMEAAYNDLLAGNLDVLTSIPDSALGTFMTDLDGRAVNQPAAVYQGFIIPGYLEHFGQDEEGNLRRQAISMAINRPEITQVIFEGTRTPATDFTAPVIPGWQESLPGDEVLEFNPEEAAARWAEAEAIRPFEGTFELAYNADGQHQTWVDAVVNSIRNTLNIDAQPLSVPAFSQFRDQITNREMNAAFRAGWQGMYPSINYFLEHQYVTGVGSNDGDYSNPEFDALIRQARAASTEAEANELYTQAQAILLRDLPSIPLWYSNATGGWSPNVDNVTFAWNSVPVFHEIVKN